LSHLLVPARCSRHALARTCVVISRRSALDDGDERSAATPGLEVVGTRNAACGAQQLHISRVRPFDFKG
jgi:hypothetical protein